MALFMACRRERSLSESFHYLLFFLLQCSILTSCGRLAGNQGEEIHLNRLSGADSPYLREHADNPVNWYEWGDEALQKAKKENKPVIISIGYAACHWCHVMEEESFMDSAVARVMNENFISIKIDREQRPDIDQIYLTAAQLMLGHSGWPLNAFALPDGKPFYTGTYFPKDEWLAVLQRVAQAYEKENAMVQRQAAALTRGVQDHELITTTGDSTSIVDQALYRDIFRKWSPGLDFEKGGLTGAPKFPMPANWEFLLQYHSLTGNQSALEIVSTTLDQMAGGGIYDQLAGGFFRYSTDGQWRVPHFEKMLYDNAQLVSLYAHAYRLTGNSNYRKVVEETLAFIESEMTAPYGGMYSSVNADSEGEEGKFYVWLKNEITAVLDEDMAGLISEYFHITDSGNWEHGKNVLYTGGSPAQFAAGNGLAPEVWTDMLNRARRDLVQVRNKRVRPSIDDKVLTSWNAMMITAFSDAYIATGKDEYLQSALKNARFLRSTMMRRDGSLLRNYKDGRATIDAFLDDYAFLAQAFIQLYQVTFDIRWLEEALVLAEFALAHFYDTETGLFFYTSDRAEHLIARKMELTDNVIPSSNSVFAGVLFQLGELFQLSSYTNKSKIMLNQVLKEATETQSLFQANWSRQAGMVAYQPFEVAVLGTRSREISLTLQKRYHPTAIFMGGEQENLPLLENKLVKDKTVIYVCRNRVCKLPAEDVETALTQLR